MDKTIDVPKCRILFLAANPEKTTHLALDEESREIDQKIRLSDHRDALDLVTKWAVRPDDLLQYLNQYRPHVVHFSGHGSETEEIILLDSKRRPKPVSKGALKQLFSTLKDNIRVVLLNACFSEPQAEAIVDVIDCAIGMKQAIGDDAAIVFAASFYRAIGFGKSVKEAFDQGKAALMLAGIPEENTPVLLVRSGVNPNSVVLVEEPSRSPLGEAPPLQALHQLPSPADLTGRDDELRDLLTLVQTGGVNISGIRAGLQGMGGVGKTALAVVLAHQLKDHWPDAQIVLNLRGADPERPPLSPAEAMQVIIHAFHPEAKLPETVDELRPIYLSILQEDNRRVLLLLDNAAGPEQIDPLLPPSDCLLLVTSRAHFTLPGLQAKNIDCLKPDKSVALLCKLAPRIGEDAARAAELCGHPQQLITWFEASVAAAKRLGDRRAEGSALGNVGNAYKNLGETRRAIGLYEQALAITREIGDRSGEGNSLGSLGIAHKNLGETHNAIRFYEQGLTIYREIGDRRAEGSALSNLGNAYAILGETGRAIQFHERALAIAREIGDRRGEGTVLGNLGIAYAKSGETRRSVEFFEQRLTIARQIGDRRGEANALGNMGIAYAALGETRRAIEFFEKVWAIHREVGDLRGEGNALFNKSLSLDKLGERPQAITHAEAALKIYEQIEDPAAETARRKLAEWRGEK